MPSNDVLIHAMGDVTMNRDNYRERWDHVLPIISQADIRYCNAEQTLSDRGEARDPSCLPWRMDPKYAPGYGYANITVASIMGNHCMEWGPQAMLHTHEVLREQGVLTFGSGKDIEEARKPAVTEVKGTRIAWLAYNSIINFGDEADVNWPGVAPMRVDTFYQQIEHNQPATPARIRSFCDPEDLRDMKDDIARAKEVADLVAVCFHNGIHYVRAEMAEYQFEAAHAAIDTGADMIFGTHPHVIKAMEVYKGRPIFYSLGDFLCDGLKSQPGFHASRKIRNLREVNAMRKPDPEYPPLGPRPGDIVNTGIAKVLIADKRIRRVAFQPMLTNPKKEAIVEPLEAGTPEFDKVVHYIEDVTRAGGVKTEYRLEGNELVLMD